MAKENGLMFLETSAKTAYNVVEAFNLSASCILNNIQKNGPDSNFGDENKKKLIDGMKTDTGKEIKGCC